MKLFVTFIICIILNYIYYCSAAPTKLDDNLLRISKSQVCDEEIKTLCSDLKLKTDVAILTCLQDSEENMQRISTNCQHYLWEYKHNLTKSDYFDKITESQCKTELTNIPECKGTLKGLKAPCLVDHKNEITGEQCSKFISDIGVIIFSDYHLIYKFVDKCMADIKVHKCGRITKPLGVKTTEIEEDSDKPISETGQSYLDYMTTQTDTLDCLTDKIKDIDKECQHQILRLAELQSNDYHLNRGLYLACREDRETLCPKVKSGEGRVYNCLMKEKFSIKMSEKCRKELTRKQQVESLDAKANYPLFHNCKDDITNNKCLMNIKDVNHDIMLMSVILMCLHHAEISGKKLQPNCKQEVIDRKSEMLDDFKISPDAMFACKKEVSDHCKAVDNEPAEVIHCLMKLAEPNMKEKTGKLSETCQNALMDVIRVANPTDNVMSGDVAVRAACASSFNAMCTDVASEKESFQCLVNNLNSPHMAPKCRDKITSLLYFISLDITIDDSLNRVCHKDAVRLCKEPESFEDSQKKSVIQKQFEYHCMYQNFVEDKANLDLAEATGNDPASVKLKLSPECSQKIFILMKVQASKIELDPIVFLPCFDYLSQLCNGPEHRGKEHECLQKNIKLLKGECHKAVIEFSKMEDVDSRLNRMLSDACVPMVQKFCSHQKPDKMLVCLAEHKFHPEMSDACHAAIEHIQITSLEEFRIDHRFATFCKSEIDKFCAKELLNEDTKKVDSENKNNKVVGKATIVACLSRTITEQLLAGEKHPLSDQCRRQFTFELLQRSESIKLDPGLVDDCGNDIKTFCNESKSMHINSCLRQHQDDLSPNCHKRLFRREHLESLDANFDGELQQRCFEMINEHCHSVSGPKLFGCLRRAVKKPNFDSNCRKLIDVRLERRMNDIRLNPGLINDCIIDIKRYCNISNLHFDLPTNGIEYKGEIILCLKTKFTNNSKSLTDQCQKRVLEIIIEANTNFKLDPILRKHCHYDMNELCKKEMVNTVDDAVNSVHNCLKYKFLKDELLNKSCKKEVARLLKEGRADVHVDVELFDACETAIMEVCRSETFGNGRKMSCLLAMAEDKKAASVIDGRCLQMIKDRREMWAKAANYEPQSLKEVYESVSNSSMRVYLLSMLGLMVAALILLGVCCGRVTKRVAVDLKNK